jgi:5-methylcytosine-specific restriction endonuclease McrA
MTLKLKKPWSPKSYLFAAARRVFRWSPERKAVANESEKLAGIKDKRLCNMCGQVFDKGLVAVDHKEPVIDPNKGFESWDTYYARLFVTRDLLQALCKECHQAKSNGENKIRRTVKAVKNGKAKSGKN